VTAPSGNFVTTATGAVVTVDRKYVTRLAEAIRRYR